MEKKSKFKQTEIGKIPEDWEVKTLKETADILVGFPFKGNKYSDKGIKVLRGENVSIGFIRWDTEKRWEDDFSQVEKYSLKENDVVIGMDGSRVGMNRAIIKKKELPLFLAQRVTRLRATNNLNQDFLGQVILSKRFFGYVESIKTGTSIPHISSNQISEFLIPLPPLPEQLQIAKILSSLDEKIEINNKMNKTLEAIGQVLFKKWFIDNPEKEGWKEGKLGDISKLKMGTSPKGESYNENKIGTPLLNGAADFSGKLITPKKFTTSPIKNCKMGDLIFCIRAMIGNITFADKEYCLGRGVAALEIKNMHREFVYYLLKSSLDEMVLGAYGSVIKGLSKLDIENLRVTIPPKEKIVNFNRVCSSMFERQFLLDKQSQTLAQIRDALLPKLMSGEIRVK